MTNHEKSSRRLIMKWCDHRAAFLRDGIGRCRTAYKEPVLGGLTNRYADALEQAAKVFDAYKAELNSEISRMVPCIPAECAPDSLRLRRENESTAAG